MNPRTIMLVVIAVAIAGVAAILARSLVADQQPTQAEAVEVVRETHMREILVAAKPLPIGRLIEAVDLKWQPWPEEAVDETYFQSGVTTMESIVGKVVRHSIVPGEPLTEAKIVGPGQRGFLAAVLGPGMRAVTVPINQTSGIAGFVFPGDRVDLILTHQVTVAEGELRQVSETVLYNVRVLAVDQRTDDLATQPAVGQTVTLEVTPKIAEMISVIRPIGSLSLSLRSLAKTDDTEGPVLNPNFGLKSPSYTWDADVSVLLPKVGESQKLSVARGSESASMDFKGIEK